MHALWHVRGGRASLIPWWHAAHHRTLEARVGGEVQAVPVVMIDRIAERLCTAHRQVQSTVLNAFAGVHMVLSLDPNQALPRSTGVASVRNM